MTEKQRRFRHTAISIGGAYSRDAFVSVLGKNWKEHPKAPSYFFSSDGLVARLYVKQGTPCVRLLRGCKSGHGYRAISYPIGNGSYGRLYIHRAVCELFHGKPPHSGMQVRHLDTNMNNNSASNLAWGTAQDNANDGKRAGKTAAGSKNPNAKLTAEAVNKMRAMRLELNATFKSIAKTFGVSTMTAHRAVLGKSWK